MDPSELAAVVAELTQTVTDIQASRYLAVAGFIVLIYDHLSTFSDEVQLIWRKPLSLVSILFLINRYTVPVIIAIDMYDKGGLARNLSDSSNFQVLSFAVTHALVALRVRALWGNRKWINALIIAMGTIYFTSTMVIDNVVDSQAFVPALAFESMLFLLTLGKAIQDRRRDLSFSGVAGVLIRDGILYFLVISSCSVFNIVVWSSLRPSLVALAKYFTFSFVNVMASRLVLNLRALRADADDQAGEELISGGSFGGDHHTYGGRYNHHHRGPPTDPFMRGPPTPHGSMAGQQIALRNLGGSTRRVRPNAGQVSFRIMSPSPPPQLGVKEKPVSLTTLGSESSGFDSHGGGTTSVRVTVDVDVAVDVDYNTDTYLDIDPDTDDAEPYSKYAGGEV
ncbi:hypothetical protein FRB96_008224 [Tulasnella sp. 330]|nr:hypothetical protein FRB96_008224 [Tulasnella sp. 330]